MEKKKAQNSAYRKKNPTGHTLGRRSYAQLLYYEALVEAAEYRRLVESQSEEGGGNLEDTGMDELEEVFGQDPKNGVRAVSSVVSRKQVQHTAIANTILEQANSESVAIVKNEVAELKNTVVGIGDTMKAMLAQLVTLGAGTSHLTTPRAEVDSTSVDRQSPVAPRNIAYLFEAVAPSSSSNNPSVILLDKNDVEVATGYVVTDGTAGICHRRKVCRGEKIVYVSEVLIPDALIYDGPQDDHTTLIDFVAGGYLIWLEARLKYT